MYTSSRTATIARPADPRVRAELDAAQRRLYDAETALHAARQSGVDAWVAAAYDRLHDAVLGYEVVCAAQAARRHAHAGAA